MGQGEEVKTRPEPQVEIQERGEIYFFYRPKVEKEEAHSANDVQKLYIVLRPESGERSVEEKQDSHSGKEGSSSSSSSIKGGHGSQEVNIEKEALLRLIVMGKKSLPDPTKKSLPYWGFVELVTTKIEDVKTALKAEEYETKTRGRRHLAAARAAGEGIYRILRHTPNNNTRKRTHTHLVYKLELPSSRAHKHDPQEALNIDPEASFLIQIKNPDQTKNDDEANRFRGLQGKRRALFPARLQAQFGNRRYGPADPPDLLNYEGCEFLLIAASDDIEEELGLELRTEGSDDDDEKACSDLVSSFGETGSTKPLFQGTWA